MARRFPRVFITPFSSFHCGSGNNPCCLNGNYADGSRHFLRRLAFRRLAPADQKKQNGDANQNRRNEKQLFDQTLYPACITAAKDQRGDSSISEGHETSYPENRTVRISLTTYTSDQVKSNHNRLTGANSRIPQIYGLKQKCDKLLYFADHGGVMFNPPHGLS